MRVLSAVLAAGLTIAASPALAETLYVEDKLVLNVYAEPDQGGARVATIQTGDVVEALERSENFVRVQLADGREGWVNTNYLSEQPPAILKLKELQAMQPQGDDETAEKNAQLTAEVAKLKKQNSALQAEVASLKKELAATKEAAQAAAPPAPPVHVENGPIEPPPPAPLAEEPSSYWWAWLLAVIGAGGGGFAAGWQTLGKRVRARFGGVKVY
ncbi:MAG TPA: TIGR04211 family SH3 domain-containing protein [Steroidobacteraceae bacterium]